MTPDQQTRLQPILSRINPAYGVWIEVGDGWHHIIIELNEQLTRIDPAYTVQQVKDKFGGLRYYCSIDGVPEAAALIDEAERKAAVTCDVCGEPGKRTSRLGWLSTRCAEHEGKQ